MLKKIVLFALCMWVVQSYAQPGYTRINSRYNWLAGMFDGLNVPSGTAPVLQTGQIRRAGALYYDSTGTDSGLYVWTGLIWKKAGGSTVVPGYGLTANGDTLSVDSSFAWRFGKQDSLSEGSRKMNFGGVDSFVLFNGRYARIEAETMQLKVTSLSSPTLSLGPFNTTLSSPNADYRLFLLENSAQIFVPSGGHTYWRGDTTSFGRRASYAGNFANTFTKHTLVDKNYVDSVSRSSGSTYTPGVFPAEYSTVTDPGDYAAFAWPVVIKDTVWAYVKRAPTHVLPGFWTVYKSTNGMQTWDSISAYNGVNASGISNLIATAIDDTIWVAWQTSAQPFIKIARSVDGGMTHTIVDSITNAAYINVPFGNFIKMPSGKIIFNYYSINASGYAVRLVQSVARNSWLLLSTLVSGSLPGAVEYNETWIEKIDGTTDATTRMIAIMRDENNGTGPLQLTSTDGGVTWNQVGRIPAFIYAGEAYPSPTCIMRIGDNLVMAKGVRWDRSGSSEDDYHVAVTENRIDSVFSDPTKWPAPSKLYRSRANYSGMPNDFGYPNMFRVGGQPRMVLYDVSNKNTGGGSVSKTRVFTMPVYTQPFGYFRSLTLQSIPQNVETQVLTPFRELDSDRMFNTDSGSVIIKRDGIYQVKAVVNFSIGLVGTYRRAFLRSINSSVNNAESNRLLDAAIVQPTNNAEFLGLQLEATTFLRQGEKVVLSAMHDNSAVINIGTNTIYSPLHSTIEIKQIK